MSDVKIKSGYARHKGETVKGLALLLLELVKQGYGDYEVAFGYDSNLVYTATDGEYEIEEKTVWFKEQEYM